MFKKYKESQGFVLIESLSALSIVTLALVIILPLIITLYRTRRQKKIEVEGHRVLYDYTSKWRGSDGEWMVHRVGEDFYVLSTSKTHRVEHDGQLIEAVELIDYDISR